MVVAILAGAEASATCTVRVEVPADVGVPAIELPSSASPVGSTPDGIDHEADAGHVPYGEEPGEDPLSALFEAMEKPEVFKQDPVRFEIMRHFGAFVTESTPHMSEYVPYFRKRPELIEEFGLTHEAAAKAVGRSRSAVTNLLRLTQLAQPVQDMLLVNQIEMGHARALLALPAARQTGAAARVVEHKLSVRDAERLVHELLHPVERSPRRRVRPAADADTARLENELAERLGAKVRIEPGRNGAGRVVIGYSSLDELDGILAKLRG